MVTVDLDEIMERLEREPGSCDIQCLKKRFLTEVQVRALKAFAERISRRLALKRHFKNELCKVSL